jgi:hypothetical protein
VDAQKNSSSEGESLTSTWLRKTAPAGRRRNTVAWTTSVLGHAVLLLLVLLLGWNISEESAPKTTPVITATTDQASLDPLGEIETEQVAPAALELKPLVIPETVSSGTTLIMPSRASLPAGGLRGAAPAGLGRVSFVGLGGGAARKIVYVVDASGSMIGAFPVILMELRRSIENLTAAQSFSIIFFQRDEAVETPPRGRLIQATEENKTRTAAWITDNILPSGRSSPMNALEKAMALQPEVVYLLSSNITGSGRYEIDTEALMAGLEALNPAAPENRRRKTIINCVQFLDEDPLGALRKIARRHGGQDDELDNETNAYRFLDRSELGLEPILDDTKDPSGSPGRP